MSITLTQNAANHVKNFLTGSAQGDALRIKVKPTGCSGFMYIVEPTESGDEKDHVFESEGIRVFIDPQSLPYLQGTELDYTKEGLNEGFRFHNPNVKDTCGCGESFSI
jgi:iron-sulfur cluster assembly protein